MATIMKEAHVHEDSSVTLHDVPVPAIDDPTQLLVKVVCTSSNPKDWKVQAKILTSIADCPNSGDDVAGIVEKVGDQVTAFKTGDRVAGLHELGARGGAYAEYAILHDFGSIHIPDSMSFEEAAVFGMANYMAASGLFSMLKVAGGPFAPLTKPTPLLIYGAASAVGAQAVKLAQLSNIHPLICVAGSAAPFVKGLISPEKGDAIVDYRNGDEALVEGIKAALSRAGAEKLTYAFDAISEKGSSTNCGRILHPQKGKLSITLPPRKDTVPPTIEQTATMAGSMFRPLASVDGRDLGNLGMGKDGRLFGYVFSRLFERLVADGSLTMLPYKVMEGGLAGLEDILKSMRAGRSGGATKQVLRIADTPGLG